MRDSLKCRNSVFCVLFLALFLLGTICGILLLNLFSQSQPGWLTSYCRSIGWIDFDRVFGTVFVWTAPIIAVWLTGMLPFSGRMILVLILFRGVLAGYAAAAYWRAGMEPWSLAIREGFLLPLFYVLCQAAMTKKRQ